MEKETKEEVLARLAQRQRERFLSQKRSAALAQKRKEARRHTFPLARVVHPAHGELIVRAESKCDAVNVAARRWGVPFVSISRETEVWACEAEAGQRDKHAGEGIPPPPDGGPPPFDKGGCERREDHGATESK